MSLTARPLRVATATLLAVGAVIAREAHAAPPDATPRAPAGLGEAATALERAVARQPNPQGTRAGEDKPNHVYHLGAKRFYLDRAQELGLTGDQRTRLQRLWEFDQVERLRAKDAVSAAEREVWRLTAEEPPSLPAVEAAVRAAERLKADRRTAFIRRVVDAAGVLTPHQREMLKMAKGGR